MTHGICPLCGDTWKWTRGRRRTPFCGRCSKKINANRTNMKKYGYGCTHHWILDNRNFGYCKRCGEARRFEPERKHTKPEPEAKGLAGLIGELEVADEG